ncbi:MAG: FAD-dependent oxidoreductase, partial [Pirellulales bacterium]|nr:FAD-dependent oxidoreductase [Pirellulales bacterium]
NTGTQAAAAPVPFPRCPWALDLSDKPFPGRSKTNPDTNKLGGWYWESGFDRDPIAEMEYVRDWNFRAMYGAWDAMKNVDQVLPNHRLNWAAYILGKRESRRLMGDVVLSFEDLESDRKFPDGCVPTGWSNDLHLPDPRYENGFEGDVFISRADFGHFPAIRERRPYWVPYRCLYSRNVSNLFMAGRDISVKHDALGAVRVMRTGGCMGEIVGMAASLCKKHGATPRSVYDRHLGELQDLMRRGVGKNPGANPDYENGAEPRPAPAAKSPPAIAAPAWLTTAGPNLTQTAMVTVPDASGAARPAALLNDGKADVADNDGRWLGTGSLPHAVEFAWKQPVTLGAARIISGYFSGTISAPIEDFTLQWHDGAGWKDVSEAVVKGNADPFWNVTFPTLKTTKIRLRITGTKIDVSRIWEVELYGPAPAR